MNPQDFEYQMKLNILRMKYSKRPLEVVGLCIASALVAVQFAKDVKENKRAMKLSKFPQGGILMNINK